MDNWLYSSVNAFRVKWTPNGVLREPTGANRAQWGVTQDDDGKIWFQGGASDFAQWVTSVQLSTSITTQHALSNIVIELAGDTAWVESAFMATHIRPGEADTPDEPRLETFWGRYVDRFEKRDGRWAIVLRQPIYEKDRLDPVTPGATIELDQALLDLAVAGCGDLTALQREALAL